MRVPAAMIVAACALAAGCTSLASRSRDRDRDRAPDRRTPAGDRDDRPWWLDGAETADRRGAAKGKTRVPAAVAETDRDTLIAGVLIDARDNRPLRGVTFVHVRPAEEIAPASGRGVGFETDPDGSFLMPGLTRGKTYILTAVREVDGLKIAAEMQVQPPAGNLRMVLGADKVSSVTPPLPPPPGLGPYEPRAATPSPAPPPSADRGWEPGTAPPTGPAPGATDPPAVAPLRKENIAGNPHPPPTAAIRPPPGTAAPAPPRPDAEPPQTRNVGQRVPNFLVSDVTGGDWEFRYARGRLILMEFWSTTCAPCQRAMPAMKRLQGDYGASGLEIVAVACEADAPLNARARDADAVARQKELNFQVYLERDGRVGEVQRLFNVQWVPTLVLLDRQGTILWRGGATDTDLARVEELVKEILTRR